MDLHPGSQAQVNGEFRSHGLLDSLASFFLLYHTMIVVYIIYTFQYHTMQFGPQSSRFRALGRKPASSRGFEAFFYIAYRAKGHKHEHHSAPPHYPLMETIRPLMELH